MSFEKSSEVARVHNIRNRDPSEKERKNDQKRSIHRAKKALALSSIKTCEEFVGMIIIGQYGTVIVYTRIDYTMFTSMMEMHTGIHT